MSQVKSNATRVGTAVGLVSATAAVLPTGSAGAMTPEACIDAIESVPADESELWTIEEWDTFLETCQGNFGSGKLIVDVVTDEGNPVPADVDLTAIVDAFDFGFADPDRDARRARFDRYCALEFERSGRFEIELGIDNHAWDDFRMDEPVVGRPVRVLQLVGDEDDPAGPGMTDFEVLPNQLLFSWTCDVGAVDQLRMLGVPDVGGGYQLLPGLDSAEFDEPFLSGDPDEVTRATVIVSPLAVPPTTTTTTTIAPTTTVAPTTTLPITAPPTPPPTPQATVAAPATLPETGRSSKMAAVASLVLAAGFACAVWARRRPA